MSLTTAERLNLAVQRHGILWADLSDRVAANEKVTRERADEYVARLIERKSCVMPVAVALIDLITERKK